MLRFKPEVRIKYLSVPLSEMLAQASLWSLLARTDVEINSIDDGPGIHKDGSLHGWSLAVDLDTVGDKTEDTFALGDYLRRVLPGGFDIVFEGDHVHVEWDTRRGPLRKMA